MTTHFLGILSPQYILDVRKRDELNKFREIVDTKHINTFSKPQILKNMKKNKIKPLQGKTEKKTEDIRNLFRLEKEGTDMISLSILEMFLDQNKKTEINAIMGIRKPFRY